jgi:putative transposase
MILVERHIISKAHKPWQEIDKLSFLSKNLYNAANYICRQHFFATRKKYSLTNLYHLTKDCVQYRALPTKGSSRVGKFLPTLRITCPSQ